MSNEDVLTLPFPEEIIADGTNILDDLWAVVKENDAFKADRKRDLDLLCSVKKAQELYVEAEKAEKFAFAELLGHSTSATKDVFELEGVGNNSRANAFKSLEKLVNQTRALGQAQAERYKAEKLALREIPKLRLLYSWEPREPQEEHDSEAVVEAVTRLKMPELKLMNKKLLGLQQDFIESFLDETVEADEKALFKAVQDTKDVMEVAKAKKGELEALREKEEARDRDPEHIEQMDPTFELFEVRKAHRAANFARNFLPRKLVISSQAIHKKMHDLNAVLENLEMELEEEKGNKMALEDELKKYLRDVISEVRRDES